MKRLPTVYPPTHQLPIETFDDNQYSETLDAIEVSDDALVKFVEHYFESFRKTVEEFFPQIANALTLYACAPFQTTVVRLGPNGVIVGHRRYGSTLRIDLRYIGGSCFKTFPLVSDGALGRLGADYHAHRATLSHQYHLGLTDIYNHFHGSVETSPDIYKLRELHVEMDQAVAAAYGWTDLDLGHGFHETKQGVRFTISEAARREVLQRLLKLNHERYAEEVKQGLHRKSGEKGVKSRESRSKSASKPGSATPTFFGMDEDEANHPQVSEIETVQAEQVKSNPRSILNIAASTSPVSTTDRPTPIDKGDADDIMAAFRQAARGRGSMDRDELLKEVSLILGYQRLGPRIEEALRGQLRAAIRRRIIEPEGTTQVRAGTTSMADYELEELRESFRSVMRKGTSYEREDILHALARYLGFARLTDPSREALKSAINSAIRQGILGYEGSSIWRE